MHIIIIGLMGLLLMACVLVGIVIYFIPTLVAINRKHPNLLAIFVLNLFLGWSFIGWVVSLIWALTKIHSTKWACNHCHYHYAIDSGPIVG